MDNNSVIASMISIVAIIFGVIFFLIHLDRRSEKNKQQEQKIKRDLYREKYNSYIFIARDHLNPELVDLSHIIRDIEIELNNVNSLSIEKDNLEDHDINVKHFGFIVHILVWMRENGYDKILSHKKKTLTLVDDYGDIDNSNFIKEYRDFINNRLHIVLNYIPEDLKENLDGMLLNNFTSNMLLKAESYIAHEQPRTDADNIENPYEYESTISDIISNTPGWSARVTSGSGDQGADVLAENEGVYLVVQCKLYNSPVGNKAVQEVAAAKGFYGGTHAIVVTNSSFTRSAKLLANSLGVALLHHNQLVDFLCSISATTD